MPGLFSRDESESAKLSPIQLYSGWLETFSNGSTRTISVADVVWAETFECEKDSKEVSAAAVRMIANFFLNITQSLSSNEFPRTKFDASMITAVGRERIRGA